MNVNNTSVLHDLIKRGDINFDTVLTYEIDGNKKEMLAEEIPQLYELLKQENPIDKIILKKRTDNNEANISKLFDNIKDISERLSNIAEGQKATREFTRILKENTDLQGMMAAEFPKIVLALQALTHAYEQTNERQAKILQEIWYSLKDPKFRSASAAQNTAQAMPPLVTRYDMIVAQTDKPDNDQSEAGKAFGEDFKSAYAEFEKNPAERWGGFTKRFKAFAMADTSNKGTYRLADGGSNALTQAYLWAIPDPAGGKWYVIPGERTCREWQMYLAQYFGTTARERLGNAYDIPMKSGTDHPTVIRFARAELQPDRSTLKIVKLGQLLGIL